MKKTIIHVFSLPVAIIYLMGMILVLSCSADATHHRAGHLTWETIPDSQNGVRFSLVLGFKRSLFTGTALDGHPQIGDIIQPGNGNNFNFISLCFSGIGGDGTPPLRLRVKEVDDDPSNDWLIANALEPGSDVKESIDKIYPTPTHNGSPWIAELEDCCRIHDQNNDPDVPIRLMTLVDVSTGNNSPRATPFLPLQNIRAGSIAQFTIDGFDPDNSETLTYRLATASEASDQSGEICTYPDWLHYNFIQPGPPNAPNALTINSSTGEVTWNTAGAPSGLWSCQVIIEDHDQNGNALKSQVPVDFMIDLLNCFNDSTPAFILPTPTCGSTMKVHAEKTISFTVKASDPDNGDRVRLNVIGLPPGATMAPALPANGNPVGSTLSWTPMTTDVGLHKILFYAQDTCGLRAQCAFFIDVLPPLCLQPVFTSGRPKIKLQQWRIPNNPNIQGLANEDDFKKVPRKIWFTEQDAGKIGFIHLPDTAKCNAANLEECDLNSTIGAVLNPPQPFKITYAKQPIPGDRLKRQVWFTDPASGTINALVHPKDSVDICRVYSYLTDTVQGKPWDIQWQPKLKLVIKTPPINQAPPITIQSPSKLWYSVNPPSNRIFAFDPVRKILQRFTIPIGVIDAFYVEAGYVWIAAREPFGNVDFIYGMPVTGGQSFQWIVNGPVSHFNSVRAMYLVNPQNAGSLPCQVWMTGTTPDSLGSSIILKLALSRAANVDTICIPAQEFFKTPNGLFTPFPAKSIAINRMFVSESLDTNFISSNRAIPQGTIFRSTVNIPLDTTALNFVSFNVPHTSQLIEPLCDSLNTSVCAENCVVEQWKAVPSTNVFNFSDALLDIDMVGNYGKKIFAPVLTRGPLAFEYFNVAFHEPRHAAEGIIERLSYKALVAAVGPDNSPVSDFDINSNDQLDESGFGVFDPYPNPFNPITTLSFTLGHASMVTMKIYNVLGQEVATLLDHELFDDGEQSVDFNASILSSGVYFYKLVAEPISQDGQHNANGKIFSSVRKMILMK